MHMSNRKNIIFCIFIRYTIFGDIRHLRASNKVLCQCKYGYNIYLPEPVPTTVRSVPPAVPPRVGSIKDTVGVDEVMYVII